MRKLTLSSMAPCRTSRLVTLLCFLLISMCGLAQGLILAPNMSSCHMPYNLPAAETPFNCCAPTAAYTPSLFRPNASSYSVIKVRRPAHAADKSYAQKLTRAYNLMRALPADDPRSFEQQANIHCAYCNTVYTQLNSTEVFQVHGSWLFFPFHRWYLYFHERILAKLLDDDTFSLSFWNYDHPHGSSMPWIFTQIPDLVDSCRDALHQPPAVVAVDYTYDTDWRPREVQLRENANEFYRLLIRDATTHDRFFGRPYRQGDSPLPGYGTVERRPHNSVHLWTGSRHRIGWRDMGTFYAAARDPIFYAHHAQIDRLWEVWKSFQGNLDIDDPDYLDSEFAFYNEDAALVRVKVRDALNTTNLGFVYEEVDNPWINAVPVRLSTGVARLSLNDTLCQPDQLMVSPCSTVVERDPDEASLGFDENLILGGIEWVEGSPTHFDIFINWPSANINTTTGCQEYVGFFTTVPMFYDGVNRTTLGYGINGRIKALNLTAEYSVVITLVPKALGTIGSPASVSSFSMEYSAPYLSEKSKRRVD